MSVVAGPSQHGVMRSHSVVAPTRSVVTPEVDASPVVRPVPWGRVGALVLAIVVGMQIGPIAIPLGHTVDRTRWADWLDLTVPYLVLGLAAWTLQGLVGRRDSWVLLAVGGLVFTQGHALHLAANSVGNVHSGAS